MSDLPFDPQKIDEFLARLRERQNSWKFGATLLLGLVLALLVASCFYTIQPEEVGVIQRFGKHIGTQGPGLHVKLPWGIDKVTKVKTQFVYKQEFGYRTVPAGARTQYARDADRELSLMLTGDLNIAEVEWSVQFRIQDPVQYLFNVRDPIRTLVDAAESSMRLVVGDRSVDEVLTVGREDINLQAREKLQAILNAYETGIRVVTVELQDVNPPDPVKESFDDVNKAKQQKETMINQALEAYNKIIPKARGQAEQTVSNAEGYAATRVNEAKGDANRFLEVFRAYQASPGITRRKLYIETMSKLLADNKTVFIVDDKLKNVLPLPGFLAEMAKEPAK